jgi:hypothetical protein
MKLNCIFTLAPADHSTDPVELENGYKLWSTFKRVSGIIYVRSNRKDTAGGQVWRRIAHHVSYGSPEGFWLIETGAGHFQQGGALLSRYLIGLGQNVRSKATAYQGSVKCYPATTEVYALPSLLNGGRAVVSRDKLADERARARRVDIAAAMAARKVGS